MYPPFTKPPFARIKSLILSMFIVPIIALAGCAPVPTPSVSQAPTAAVTQDPSPSQFEYVDGKGYRFTWSADNNGVLLAPADVKEKALEACLKDGFVSSYMSSIAFTDNLAEGFFNCRGSGGS